MSDDPPHVVIVGGGFAGLNAAKALRNAPVRVTLIDKRNFHLFQPLLYQVATASLGVSEIAYPIRSILRKQENTTVLLGEVTGIDLAARQVVLESERVAFDYLVVATGSQSSWFGHDDWERRAPSLKSVEDALAIRHRVLNAFERAEREHDPERRAALLTFVIVGGGPTGVELAGSLAEISRQTLRHEFRTYDPAGARIVLAEGSDDLLGTYPPRLRAAARRSLEKLGVEVRTGVRVDGIEADHVRIGNETIATETVLWSAGVVGERLGGDLGEASGVKTVNGGRVPVMATLQLGGHPNVYIAGDLAASRRGKKGDAFLPNVAQVAMQGGRAAAKNIRRDLAGQPLKPFRYFDKGDMATIGWNRAVAKVGPLQLSGFLAWAIWAMIHIAFLINFRGRMAVMVQWLWAYATRGRGARLITGADTAAERPARWVSHPEPGLR